MDKMKKYKLYGPSYEKDGKEYRMTANAEAPSIGQILKDVKNNDGWVITDDAAFILKGVIKID